MNLFPQSLKLDAQNLRTASAYLLPLLDLLSIIVLKLVLCDLKYQYSNPTFP